MPTIRVRLVANGGPAGGFIRAAQLGWPYTHVDAAIDGAYLGAHLVGGVALRPIGYDAAGALAERFYELEIGADAAAAFRAYLLAQLGKSYDLEAIAAFAGSAFVHPGIARSEGAWLEPDRWFCSELVAAALIHAGVFPHELAASARHVTPQNLAFALSAVGRVAISAKAA